MSEPIEQECRAQQMKTTVTINQSAFTGGRAAGMCPSALDVFCRFPG
jgi:hypothetical protein